MEVRTGNTIDWKRKLTSRKLWVSIVGLVTGLIIYFGGTQTQASEIGAIIMSLGSVISYIIGEGMADAANVCYEIETEVTQED